jgi:hypothetical protein
VVWIRGIVVCRIQDLLLAIENARVLARRVEGLEIQQKNGFCRRSLRHFSGRTREFGIMTEYLRAGFGGSGAG